MSLVLFIFIYYQANKEISTLDRRETK
jgi:hypothetical protein